MILNDISLWYPLWMSFLKKLSCRDGLLLISGICWTLTYLLIIRLGFKEAVYGMPFVALCANLSWEFIFSFVHPQKKSQRYVNYVWLFFDLVIFYQFLKFGSAHLQNISTVYFYPTVIVTLVIAYFSVLLISREFDDTYHGKYAAFGQNLLMSVLFVYS